MKKRICALAAMVIMAALLLSGCSDPYSKDLSELFYFNFDMEVAEVIVIEGTYYGNHEYRTEELANAEKWDVYSENDDPEEYCRTFFFDNKNGKLIGVWFVDRRSDSDHSYNKGLTAALLDMAGEYDEVSDDGGLYYVYGRIGGEKCVVTYDADGEIFCIDKIIE